MWSVTRPLDVRAFLLLSCLARGSAALPLIRYPSLVPRLGLVLRLITQVLVVCAWPGCGLRFDSMKGARIHRTKMHVPMFRKRPPVSFTTR